MTRRFGHSILLVSAVLMLTGCASPAPQTVTPVFSTPPAQVTSAPTVDQPLLAFQLPATREPGAPYYTPTPDAPRTLPTFRPDAEYYVVQYGDSLGYIASQYQIDLEMLIAANDLPNPDVLEIGQVITIPALQPGTLPSDFKIIPDSELVNSPASTTLDIKTFVKSQNGYLAGYREDVAGEEMTGIQIVRRISQEFSVNPRLLLALLEYRSGWLTSREISESQRDYPMGYENPVYKGLYLQLAWTAKNLNKGFYAWKINALSYTPLVGGKLAPLSTTINAGTAAVQYMMGLHSTADAWNQAVSENGVYRTYTNLFGLPFDRAIEPLLPADLTQPELALPFEPGVIWSFTGGPHSGWGDGSAWAALDFAPPGDQFGCFTSNDWVTASADGVIARADNGAVVLDLDGDGYEQSGWTILYMHIETRDRVSAGTRVKAGDRIGHPSCEGGVSDGTHVHVARRYNGEWISADGSIPFVMSNWVSAGDGEEYDGTLTRGEDVVYSWNGRVDENQIGQ